MADDFPVGTILPFAGSWEECSAKLQGEGWTLCDGSPVPLGSNPALYAVIGSAYGADGTSFYLPDLRGYFLRSVDPTGAMDPDGPNRTAPTKYEQPGNAGLLVGSIQPHGVGPHEHEILYYSNTIAQRGSNGRGIITPSTNLPDNGTTQSGDNMGLETRPVNMYVHFIIKIRMGSLSASAAACPGTVVYYTGDPSSSSPPGWLSCDGSVLDSSYPDLAAIISQYYGATAENQSLLPDYRGVFLRGVDEAGKIDPDAASRTPPRPDQPTQGNQGALVGSWQTSNVAPHTHSYGWPLTQCCLCCCGMYCCCTIMFNDCCGVATVETTDGTGCAGVSLEVRPRNSYVNHLVSAVTPSAGTPLDIPVGSVIGFAGPEETMNDPSWMLCNGALLPVATYSALNDVVNCAFGGDDNGNFCLPWYVGMFLRGVDGGRNVDTDASLRTAPAGQQPNQGNTGDAVGSYQADCVMPHTHQYSYQTENPDSSGNGNAAASGFPEFQASTPNTTLQTTAGTTGASDTRPVNAYVNFFIKVQ
jgi:microcystin-dependent protein